MADARRSAVAVLLALLAGAVTLASAPFGLGAIRLAGVSFVWWYAALGAPVVAVAVAIAVLLRGRA